MIMKILKKGGGGNEIHAPCACGQKTLPFTLPKIHKSMSCFTYLRRALLLSFDIIFFRLSEYTSVHPAQDTQIYELLPV